MAGDVRIHPQLEGVRRMSTVYVRQFPSGRRGRPVVRRSHGHLTTACRPPIQCNCRCRKIDIERGEREADLSNQSQSVSCRGTDNTSNREELTPGLERALDGSLERSWTPLMTGMKAPNAVPTSATSITVLTTPKRRVASTPATVRGWLCTVT